MAMTTAEAIATLDRALSAAERAVRAANRPDLEQAIVAIESAVAAMPTAADLSHSERESAQVLSRRARSLFLAIEQAATADAILLRALRDIATTRAGADLGPTAVDLRG